MNLLEKASPKTDYRVVGHCGRIFYEYEQCEEWKIDDLCQGCCMNDDEEEESYE